MRNKKHNMFFNWVGLRRVVEVKSKHVFEVKNLVTKNLETVNVHRMILYKADMDGFEVDDVLFEYAKHSEASV